jgi:O-antigen ligase
MSIPLGRNPYFVFREQQAAEKARVESELGGRKESFETKYDNKTRKLMFAWCCLLSYFIFWFDDPEVPIELMSVFGICFFVFLSRQLGRNVDWVFFIFAVFVSFQKVLPGDFGGRFPMLNLTNILIVFMVVGWMRKQKNPGAGLYSVTLLDAFLLTYITFLTVSMLRSEFVSWSAGSIFHILTDFKRLNETFLVYFIFYRNIENKRQVLHLMFAACIVVGAVGVMGVKQYYMDIGAGSFNNMDKNQITILTDQPNQLGAFLGNYAFFPFAVWYFNRKKWWGWACLLMFAFSFQAVRVTFSRGGLLAFCAGLSVVLLLLMRWRIIFLIPFVIMICVTYPQKVLGPRLYRNLVMYQNSKDARMGQDLGTQTNMVMDKSAASRWTIMKAGIQRVKAKPLTLFFGVGQGKFSYEVSKVKEPFVGYVDAHNQWLLILVESGLVALLAFWMVMAILMYKALRIYFGSQEKVFKIFAIAFMGGLTSMFFGNFVGSRMNSNEITLLFWILAACLMKIRSIEMKKDPVFLAIEPEDEEE